MKTHRFAIRNLLSIAALALLANVPSLFAQGTAFTYQGRLNDGGNPANGTYDILFRAYDALTGGTPLTVFPFGRGQQWPFRHAA